MLKLLGSALVAAGGVLAWYLQRTERRRRQEALADFQRVFRRMGEGVRLARTPLPELLRELSADCGEEAVGFFRAVSQAAGGGEDLPRVWRERAETLTLEPWDRSAISDLGGDLQGDEEKVCKAISHVAYELAKSAEETERKRPEREKQAMALWFSSAALLVILLI